MLTKIYASFIRPVIEYASVVYDSLLTEEASFRVEDLQSHALRLIYGRKYSYEYCLNASGLERLEERRTKTLNNFAEKNRQKPSFSGQMVLTEPGSRQEHKKSRKILDTMIKS